MPVSSACLTNLFCKGQHAIAVNDQWRVCLRFVDGDAYDVEICDYH